MKICGWKEKWMEEKSLKAKILSSLYLPSDADLPSVRRQDIVDWQKPPAIFFGHLHNKTKKGLGPQWGPRGWEKSCWISSADGYNWIKPHERKIGKTLAPPELPVGAAWEPFPPPVAPSINNIMMIVMSLLILLLETSCPSVGWSVRYSTLI